MCYVSHLQAKEEQNAMELKYQTEITAHVKLSSLYKVNNYDNNNNNSLSPVFQGFEGFSLYFFVGSGIGSGDQESRA